jgi:hypothetical protein
MKALFDPVRYKRWRDSIPFSDEQIAQVLNQEADRFARDGNGFMAARYRRSAQRVTKGRVYGHDVSFALPFLIKSCAICRKKALYRTAQEGRCREHRLIPSKRDAKRIKIIESRATAFEAQEKGWEKRQQAQDYIRRTPSRGKVQKLITFTNLRQRRGG